jgi:UDP-glucose 4-epimerase
MIGVYGAGGFIGRTLVSRLALTGVGARAVVRSAEVASELAGLPGIEWITADLSDARAVEKSLDGIHTVVHLMSTSSPRLGSRSEVEDVLENVVPHVAFLKWAGVRGVRRVVFISSGGAVYGPRETMPITEDAPARPVSSYGLTKLVTEQYVHMLSVAHGMEYAVLRVANAFGPGQRFQRGQGLIPAILARVAAGLPVEIHGDGRMTRDYVYIEDVVDAIFAAASVERPLRDVINVGSGVGRSVLDVVATIESVLGRPIPRAFVAGSPTDVSHNVLAIERARALLGWEPSTTFSEGIAATERASASG